MLGCEYSIDRTVTQIQKIRQFYLAMAKIFAFRTNRSRVLVARKKQVPAFPPAQRLVGGLNPGLVQLEVEVEDGISKPVIRYDCAHDFGHRDRYNLKGDQDKREIALSYAESLDLADKDINENWDIYQEHFLRGDFP